VFPVKKLSLITILSLVIFTNTSPISKKGATIMGAIGGTAIGTTVGVFTYKIANQSILTTALASLTIGAISGFALYKIIYNTLTPEGIYKSSYKNILKVRNDPLVSKDLITVDNILNYTTARFKTNWPLVSARQELYEYSILIGNTLSKLENAILELSDSTESTQKTLLTLCNELKQESISLLQIIEDKIKIIINHATYIGQETLYERERLSQIAQTHETVVTPYIFIQV
jgi:hypothetical protein